MAGYANFESKNKKHIVDRTDIYEPDFLANVNSLTEEQGSVIEKNLDRFEEFKQWSLWYPDLFLDLNKPPSGGWHIDFDQRILLRVMFRYFSTYGVFPRGYGKTTWEVAGLMLMCIFFPDIEISITAQTKENSMKFIRDKYNDIKKHYPFIENEISKVSFNKDTAELHFRSGAKLDNLANSDSAKGMRRHRIVIEESALLNNEIFEDALAPVADTQRRTVGKEAVVNPEELNGMISFFTTAGWRGSHEFNRIKQMTFDMANNNGVFVIGADWRLALNFNRGLTKSQIMNRKDTMSEISFAQNYGSKWVGSTDKALINIESVINARLIEHPEIEPEKDADYYLAIDVARSPTTNANQGSIMVLKGRKDSHDNTTGIDLVNIIKLPNTDRSSIQALKIKKIWYLFDAKMVIVDENGVGQGIKDSLMEETFDPDIGENYPAFEPINIPEEELEIENKVACMYAMKSSRAESSNTDIILAFLNVFAEKRVRLLIKDDAIRVGNESEFLADVLPHVETDLLVEEISNLKLDTEGKVLKVDQVSKKVNKDRFMALAYGLWYIYTQVIKKDHNGTKKDNNSKLYASLFN